MKLSGKRIAIYARYSSDRQRESSIEDQLRVCRDFVAREGGQVAGALIFSDSAMSATTTARPGFEKMMALVQSKPAQVDAIVIEHSDRLSRDFADAGQIFKRLQFAEVTLYGACDGVDTSAKGAKLNYSLRSIIADTFIEDLREKTWRGLVGRALQGQSTGALPYGYISKPVTNEAGNVTGYQILVDSEQAEIVKEIFELNRSGHSTEKIAAMLNERGLEPPRPTKAGRKPGWVASCVRSMLVNEKYIGQWTFGKRRWVRDPLTGKRTPKARNHQEVVRKTQPELAIIDLETWAQIQSRFAQRKLVGSRPARRSYLFSGLLKCADCGSVMTIIGGDKDRRYYRCSLNKHRSTCKNSLSVLESVARKSLLDAIGEHLKRGEAISYVRKKITERLRETLDTQERDLKETRQRLARTEERIRGLVQFLADGDHSVYVVSALKDLEAQALRDKKEIAEAEARSRGPVRLPHQDEILARVFELDKLLSVDIDAGREALRKLFSNGSIALHANQGVYTAHCDLLPLGVFLLQGDARLSAVGCGGPLSSVYREIKIPLEIRLVA